MDPNDVEKNPVEPDNGASGNDLFTQVYWDLHQLAQKWMAGERNGHTLQATALVHEAYVRLYGKDEPFRGKDRQHFFNVAADAMWRVLIEHARKREALKRGGGWQRHRLETIELGVSAPGYDILALHEALGKLETIDARKARLVKLRYLVGMTTEEAAQVLEVSTAKANKDWLFAKAWLELELNPTPRRAMDDRRE